MKLGFLNIKIASYCFLFFLLYIIMLLSKSIFYCIFTILTFAQVQIQTLQYFIQHAYDHDADGEFGLLEWKNYFTFIEPDIQINSSNIVESFNFYDEDGNGKVSFNEILSKVQVSARIGPKQLHLGLTGKNNQMQIMWITQPEKQILPVVQYGIKMNHLDHIARANWTEYNVGRFGFHGRIYKAVMQNLVPRIKYFYRVGDQNTGEFSQIKNFISPPNTQYQLQRINFAVFGDMGTIMPFGYLVSETVATENHIDPFDFVLHLGDIAYASNAGGGHVDAKETQPIWDLFGQIIEKWASYTAYMPGVGNHQLFHNFTAYNNRYYLPRSEGSNNNFWFSFDYAQVHIIHFSTEHPYNKGTDQYNFMQNDLKKARNNPNTKWILLGGHRPLYAASGKFDQKSYIVMQLEDLINTYKVDIVLTGHMHCYQRTWPVYKGKALKQNQKVNQFINPQGPIYVVQGTAGALIYQKFIDPIPEWHIKHYQKYGFGKIIIQNNTLTYQYISTIGKIIDEWSITK